MAPIVVTRMPSFSKSLIVVAERKGPNDSQDAFHIEHNCVRPSPGSEIISAGASQLCDIIKRFVKLTKLRGLIGAVNNPTCNGRKSFWKNMTPRKLKYRHKHPLNIPPCVGRDIEVGSHPACDLLWDHEYHQIQSHSLCLPFPFSFKKTSLMTTFLYLHLSRLAWPWNIAPC